MTRGAIVAALAAASMALPDAAGATAEVALPPARVGDAWSIDVEGTPFALRIAGLTTARDRWGRLRDVADVEVEGTHPLELESKQVVAHHVYVDAAGGTQIADHTEYVFGQDPGASDVGQYASFEPNNPDGWPGWALAGGLLAGRTLVPGGTVTVPFVLTGTRGADRITLSIAAAAPGDGVPCVRATGAIDYPTFTGYGQDGWYRSTMRAELDILHCADAAVAREVTARYSGAGQYETHSRRSSFSAGGGPAIGAGEYVEPATHVAASRVPFDGRVRDGGALGIFSLDAAQDAAALAPGLLGWRAVHPDGYLVEAEYVTPQLQGSLQDVSAERWRLVYAAPSGRQHEVLVEHRGGRAVAVDSPKVEEYPTPVPPLSTWPASVISPAGAIQAWRLVAGASAVPDALRWTPLVNQRWFVTGSIQVRCAGEPCGTVFGEIWLEHDSGALGTGETPVP